jgi:hypothetical protein
MLDLSQQFAQDSLVRLNFVHMGAKAHALPKINKPCLILREKYLNIT